MTLPRQTFLLRERTSSAVVSLPNTGSTQRGCVLGLRRSRAGFSSQSSLRWQLPVRDRRRLRSAAIARSRSRAVGSLFSPIPPKRLERHPTTGRCGASRSEAGCLANLPACLKRQSLTSIVPMERLSASRVPDGWQRRASSEMVPLFGSLVRGRHETQPGDTLRTGSCLIGRRRGDRCHLVALMWLPLTCPIPIARSFVFFVALMGLRGLRASEVELRADLEEAPHRDRQRVQIR